MAWLDDFAITNKFTQVVDKNGNVAGWIENRLADILDLEHFVVETPKRYMTDPFIRQTAALAKEMGALNQSNLSEIQQILLITNLVRDREEQEELHIRNFEENLWMTNGDLFKAYKEQKEKMAQVEEDMAIEETTPDSFEDFFDMLNAFASDEPNTSDEYESTGWLDAVLDDDDLSQMGD